MSDPTKAKPSGNRMVLTERDRQLIATIHECGVLTRVQVARALRFGSVTRVNAVLLRLTTHGYLRRRIQASLRGDRRFTYTLGPTGARLLGLPDPSTRLRTWQRVADLFLEHRLLVNDVRLAFQAIDAAGYALDRWLTEGQLKSMQIGLVPDAYAEYHIGEKAYACFIEADNGTESRSAWRGKIAAYLDLAFSGRFERAFARQFFRVLVVTTSVRRAHNIRDEIARQTDRLFWVATAEAFSTHGPFGPIWIRPAANTEQSLTQASPP